MKILDRYVLITFLKNYVISLTVLVGMYVMMDMVFHFNDLITVNTAAAVRVAEELARARATSPAAVVR